MKRLVKRLVKKSKHTKQADLDTVKETIKSVTVDGRTILKALENYKYDLEHIKDVTITIPELHNKLIQKIQMLDRTSSQLYGIVFDLENYDIVMPITDNQLVSGQPPIDLGGEVPNLSQDTEEQPQQEENTETKEQPVNPSEESAPAESEESEEEPAEGTEES